jgi:DNA polymerase III epsilon subunit-like protein
MADSSYAVIDTETTGLDPEFDRVISVAVVVVEGGVVRLADAVQVMVDPGMPIPPESTAVHGITDADVAGAVALPDAIAAIAPLIADRIVVGHNLGFDLAFLDGLVVGRTLDTLSASRLLWRWPGTRHGLEHLAARVFVQPTDRHTALGDAVATAEVLLACLPMLAARGLDSPESVALAYSELRVRRARVRRSIRRRSIRPPRVPRSRRLRSARPPR